MRDFNKTAHLEDAPKTICPVIIMVDTSAGMTGRKIAEVEEFYEKYISILSHQNQMNPKIEFRLSVLSVDYTSRIDVSFECPSLADVRFSTGGGLDLSTAFVSLERELCNVRMKIFEQGVDFVYPTLIMIVNHGESINDANAELLMLKQNKWFTHGNRMALSLDDDVDTTSLEGFTGGTGTIIKTNDFFHSWGMFCAKLMAYVSINSPCFISEKIDENILNKDAFDGSANNSAMILAQAIETLDGEEWISKTDVLYKTQDGCWMLEGDFWIIEDW